MDPAFYPVPSATTHSTESTLLGQSPQSNAHTQESAWSRMFNSTSALNRPFSRLSRKANSILPTSINFSTSHEPLEVLQSLLDTLRKSQVPGPQLIRLREEFNLVIGNGAQCDVLGPSVDSECLLRAAILKESDARTATALQTYKAIAIKRTRTLGDSSETATSQGTGTRGLRDQLISAQKDINALCHESFRRHPNIVRLRGWGLCLDTLEDPSGESPSIPLLILERADWNLSEFLQSRSRWSCPEPNDQQLRKVSLDIGKGLDAIHKENITHGDLKPDNVLVFLTQSKCTAKLCDFGLATPEKKGNEALAEYRGTPGWRPPESSRTVTSASLVLCDVFAYGLVVWCIATLDWRSPIGEPEVLREQELYYHAWRRVQEANVIPSGDELNRILRALRGSLHAQPRLRERSPWNYLDEKRFPVIASVYNPTQSSASLIVFDFLMQATAWASDRKNTLPKATDLRWLPILSSCFLVSETLSGRLRLLFGAVLGALFKLVSLGMHTWMSRSVLVRQAVYEKWFVRYQTNFGHIISMDLDGINPFAHPLYQCLDIRSIRSNLHWQCLRLQQDDPGHNHLTQPGLVEDEVYALARLRSRFHLCCWKKDGDSPNILMEALSCIDDSASLAWLCRGTIGQAELHNCPKEALWRSTYEKRFSRSQGIERLILLLQVGGNVEDQVSAIKAPTSAFGRIL